MGDTITTKKKSQFREVWERLVRNKVAMVGLVVFVALILMAIFADVIVDYDMAIKQDATNRFAGSSLEHPFGTDELGRDLFARIVHGARLSVSLGVAATALSLSIAVLLGAIAGYFGGIVDEIIMRITDIFLAIPAILLSISIVASMGQSTMNLLIAMTIAFTPRSIRIMRASTLSVRNMEYIEAAKAIGGKNTHIILKHVLINIAAPIIVQASMGVADAIMMIASLSYLGLGAQPPTPEWGALLSNGKDVMRRAPQIIMWPGVFLLLTTLSLNLLGDGLRDALDPKLK